MTAAFLAGAVIGPAGLLYLHRWLRAEDAGTWHLLSFVAAMTGIAVAQGPLFALAEQRSAVAHVVLLILTIHVVPFFFLRAATPDVLGTAAPHAARFARRLPVLVPLGLLALVAYGWHAPPLFDAATRSAGLGSVQHLSFVAVGMLTWLPICAHPMFRPELRGLTSLLYLTGDELILGALGIALTWAPRSLYEAYADEPRLWGLSADTDQMLSGAVLTVVEEAPMAIALAVVFIRMLERDEAALLADERELDDGD